MEKFKRIAIIGSGISGLTAAHILHKQYDITVFEKNTYIGGHTNTINISEGTKKYAVDTGFIVFNEKTYPNFMKLLEKLKVPKQKSNMSFSFSSIKRGLEYNGSTLNSLFCDRKNLLNGSFYRLLFDIYGFNRRARKFIRQTSNPMTLNQFLNKALYGDYFKDCYFNPLASAIWSMPAKHVGNMPAQFLLDFYNNHGLLNIIDRPQWYVIKGGSKEYVKKITKPFLEKIELNTAVKNIRRTKNGVAIMTKCGTFDYDAVVLACHSDEALKLLETPSEAEYSILSDIPYKNNTAILHTDSKALPKNQLAWASWNYIQDNEDDATLTYYMNQLQSINSQNHYCVSINNRNINKEKIIKVFNYSHPTYNTKSVTAKKHRLFASLRGTQ